MAMTEDWLAGCGPMPSEKSAPPPRLVPDRPPLLARLRCLGTLLQQLNAQTACAAVNEAIEALQDAAATPAEAPGEGGGWPARWFASGPEGEFFTSSHAFAEALIAGRDRDDWTITDLSEGDTCTAPAAPAGDALLQRVIGDVESGDYDGGISEATYNSISAYLAAAAAAPAPFPSGNIHSPIQDTPPEYSRAGTPDAPAAPATNPDEISSKLVEPAAPAEGAWVAMISGIDEYGPMLDWNTHWVDVGVGTKLYTAPRVTGGRAITAAMVDAACEAYWGDGWQEPEHEGIAEARRIDARFMLEAALQAATGGASE